MRGLYLAAIRVQKCVLIVRARGSMAVAHRNALKHWSAAMSAEYHALKVVSPVNKFAKLLAIMLNVL